MPTQFNPSPSQHDGPPNDAAPHPADERAVQVYAPQSVGVSKTNESATNVLAARAAKEIEARTIVAMNRPRNIETFRLRILAACQRTRFAEAALYSKPVGGKDITGLSIRFAEECARHYQNLDIKAFAISEDEERRVFEMVAVDLETNVTFTAPVIVPKTVWRLNPKGEKPIRSKINASNKTTYLVPADDDSLLVLQSNMLAKAQREVILKHIPSDVKEEAEEAIVALLKARVEQDPEGEKRKIFDGFFQIGVMPTQIEEFLGHPVAQINPAELHLLRRIYRGIRDEGATWAQVMAEKRNENPPAASTEPSGEAQPTKGAAAGLRKKATPAAAPAETKPEESESTRQSAEPRASPKPASDGPEPEKCPECRADAPHHMKTCSHFDEE